MWWSALAWATDAPCPDDHLGGHQTATASAVAATAEEAVTLAGDAAKAKLVAPWCDAAPNGYECRVLKANAAVTDKRVTDAGREYSACALAAIRDTFVDDLTAQREDLEGAIGALAAAVDDKKVARVFIAWSEPVPQDLPREWIEVTLKNALSAADVLAVGGEGIRPGDRKLLLAAASDVATGGFAVHPCFTEVDRMSCEETLGGGLHLPNLGAAQPAVASTSETDARPGRAGLWAGFGAGVLAGTSALIAGQVAESSVKRGYADGTRTHEEALAARTPANLAYGLGYGALAVAGGFGVGLVVTWPSGGAH